jgi:transposase
LDAQEARLRALEATVTRLEAHLAAARKDSSTSSKPPSSDIVKPPKSELPEGQERRHIGGQPGHPKHERDAFPPESINGASVDYHLDLCPCCGRDLQPMPTIEPRVIQQVDIKDVPLESQEHRGHPGWCSHCRKEFEAPLPIGIERGGLVGPRLTTLIAYLKGVCHASYSTVRKFIRDVVGVKISRGQLVNIIAKLIFYSCASVFDVSPFVMDRESDWSDFHSATSHR